MYTHAGNVTTCVHVYMRFLTRNTCYSLCITASPSVDPPVAPSNLMVMTNSTITWFPSALGLSHNISVHVYNGSTSDCPFQLIYSNCNSIDITGIPGKGGYSITVCSSSVMNGEPCMREVCAFPLKEGMQTKTKDKCNKIIIYRAEWRLGVL